MIKEGVFNYLKRKLNLFFKTAYQPNSTPNPPHIYTLLVNTLLNTRQIWM